MHDLKLMDKDKKNPLNLDDDKIREIERKMSQSSNVTEPQSGDFQGVNIKYPEEIAPAVTPPAPATSASDTLPPIAPPSQQTVIKNLRTYQGDVAEVIKNKNASVLTIALAEKKKQDQITIQEKKAPTPSAIVTAPSPQKEPRKPLDPAIKKNILLGTVSILLIALGVGAIYGFYVLQKDKVEISGTPQDKTLVSWNQKTSINVTSINKSSLIEKINELRETVAVGNGETYYVSLERNSQEAISKISTKEFLEILDTEAPAPLLRSFKDSFMFGFFGIAGARDPFLLIELDSFDLAFSGMLSWEKTMYFDIGSIFTRKVVTIRDAALPATTTSTSSIQTRIINFDNPDPEGFEDVTIRNKDARVLKNNAGDTILLYSFIDRKFLLITSNEAVLREIINKLVAEQQIR